MSIRAETRTTRRGNHGRRWVPLAALFLCAPWACDDEGQRVKSYRAPKDPAPAVEASHSAPPADVPRGMMAWDVPEGWRQEPNSSQMRFSTLSAGDGDDRIEVSISYLAGSGGGVRPNIDRWRGQVGLGPATEAELLQQAQPIQAHGAQGLMVHLVGPSSAPERPAKAMLAAIFPAATRTWFLKATGSAPLIAKHHEKFAALCRSVRFEASSKPPEPGPPAPAGPRAAMPSWDLPAGWVQESPPRPMSLASFKIAAGDGDMAVTITPLPGPPQLLENLNRWRRQVGLGPRAALDEDPPTTIEVAGQPGHWVDLAGPGGHTIGVIAQRQGRTWFYKLSGQGPAVADQKPAFQAFIRSIRFDDSAGG